MAQVRRVSYKLRFAVEPEAATSVKVSALPGLLKKVVDAEVAVPEVVAVVVPTNVPPPVADTVN